MDQTNIINRLAFCGEQALSYLDEISKTPCPSCGRPDLSITWVGKSLVIRCSEVLNDYNDEEGILPDNSICNFVKIVKIVNIHEGPFILKFDDTKRATPQNRVQKKRGPGRPRTRKTAE
jgi:hypothetical protein